MEAHLALKGSGAFDAWPGHDSVLLLKQGSVLKCRALEHLAAGVSIQHCYGPQCGESITPVRQRLLLQQYYFECRQGQPSPSSTQRAFVGRYCSRYDHSAGAAHARPPTGAVKRIKWAFDAWRTVVVEQWCHRRRCPRDCSLCVTFPRRLAPMPATGALLAQSFIDYLAYRFGANVCVREREREE